MKVLFLRVCLTLLVGIVIASVSQWFMEKGVKAERKQIEQNSVLFSYSTYKYK